MEVFVKNELDEDFSEFNAKTRICCGLCDKGNLIQQQIVQHLKKKHSKGKQVLIASKVKKLSSIYPEFGKRMLINSCSCPENVQLQISLINHLLSHISFDKYNVPSSPANEIYERKLKTDEDSSEDNSWDEDDFPHPEVEFNFVSDVSQISTSNLSLQGAIEDEEIFKCSDCPVVRSTQIGLTSHTQREHDPSNLFLCSIDNTICRSRFKTSELLKNHLKYHYIGFNNSEETSKNCAVCSRSYKTKESLMKHVKRHLNAEETYTKNAEDIEYYQCDKCEKKWPKHQKTNLRQHIIKVHLKSATKLRPMLKRRSRKDPTGKVICYICSEYVLPSSLKQHIFNRHDKRSENVCEIEGCGACFLYPSGLQKHKEFHQGIKKMECEYCGKK